MKIYFKAELKNAFTPALVRASKQKPENKSKKKWRAVFSGEPEKRWKEYEKGLHMNGDSTTFAIMFYLMS